MLPKTWKGDLARLERAWMTAMVPHALPREGTCLRKYTGNDPVSFGVDANDVRGGGFSIQMHSTIKDLTLIVAPMQQSDNSRDEGRKGTCLGFSVGHGLPLCRQERGRAVPQRVHQT